MVLLLSGLQPLLVRPLSAPLLDLSCVLPPQPAPTIIGPLDQQWLPSTHLSSLSFTLGALDIPLVNFSLIWLVMALARPWLFHLLYGLICIGNTWYQYRSSLPVTLGTGTTWLYVQILNLGLRIEMLFVVVCAKWCGYWQVQAGQQSTSMNRLDQTGAG
jgi:hypothetical protein